MVVWWWCCGAHCLKGKDRFLAGPRAFLRWFQRGRNRLGSQNEKSVAVQVMVKAVVYEAQGGEDRFPAGLRAILGWFQR